MDSFLKRQAGPQAHLWDMVASRSLPADRDLPCAHDAYTGSGRRARHSAPRVHGLYPTIDDVAKLTTLLQNGGQHQGQQLLSAAKLAEALYKTGAMGLPTGEKNRFGEHATTCRSGPSPIAPTTGVFFQIPYMAGYGAISSCSCPTASRPSGSPMVTTSTWKAWCWRARALRPFCSAPVENLPPSLPKRQPLTASELYAEFSGHTFYGDRWQMFPAAGGAIYRKSKDAISGGTWRITPDGQFCRAWWEARRERCYNVYQEGEKFELYLQDSWGKVVSNALQATRRVIEPPSVRALSEQISRDTVDSSSTDTGWARLQRGRSHCRDPSGL